MKGIKVVAEEDLEENEIGINMQDNPCIRCGKTRIVTKSWSENIDNSMITYTLTVCPDPDCQKIVEEDLQKKKDKITLIHEQSEKRRKNNIRNRKTKNL